MNTTIESKNELLDKALVQCLRLFAQYGRKVRIQKMLAKPVSLDDRKVTKEALSFNDKGSSQECIG
ncbi:MAG: hypothetical protein HZB50_15065 [Chloroflexi bacterium]|nr:hypothetical protein [Chloroflexota bacterium]